VSLRIGVTGHRVLPADPTFLDRTRLAVDDAAALAADNGQVTVVSALAEGADRLVASEVLDRPGATLEVVLPTTPDEYEGDFVEAESRDEFRLLLHRAKSVTVVPAAGSRTANFERAGHAMLDQIDVLLALWDGKPARGRGGTAEIVKRAQKLGLPVVWVSTVAPFPVRRLERSQAEGAVP
jgi:hypothetical protein